MGQVKSKERGKEDFWGRDMGRNMERVVTVETVHRGEEKRARNGRKNYLPKFTFLNFFFFLRNANPTNQIAGFSMLFAELLISV